MAKDFKGSCIDPEYFCNIIIVDCGPGTFTDGSSCIDCVVGEYQPEKFQTSCMACPSSLTTVTSGSKSLTDCIGIANLHQCNLAYFTQKHYLLDFSYSHNPDEPAHPIPAV